MVPKHNLFTGTVEVRIRSARSTPKAATKEENDNPIRRIWCRPCNDLLLIELIAEARHCPGIRRHGASGHCVVLGVPECGDDRAEAHADRVRAHEAPVGAQIAVGIGHPVGSMKEGHLLETKLFGDWVRSSVTGCYPRSCEFMAKICWNFG